MKKDQATYTKEELDSTPTMFHAASPKAVAYFAMLRRRVLAQPVLAEHYACVSDSKILVTGMEETARLLWQLRDDGWLARLGFISHMPRKPA